MEPDSPVMTELLRAIETDAAIDRELSLLPEVTPEALRADLRNRYDFRQGIPLDILTRDVGAALRDGTLLATHPRYFGLFNPSVLPSGVVADTLAAVYNPQLAAWSHAPLACEMERHALAALARLMGYDPDATAANFTSGGAEANLSGVLAALAHHFPEAAVGGLGGQVAPPAIYVTGESHHSFVKVARMTGLGTDALREVPVSHGFVMDVDALRTAIRRDRAGGRRPFFLVGTAGTTSSGAIDPLSALADVAASEGLWFHVDAAWGGTALLAPRLRPALAGIERADSVTWDAHKWMSVPMGAGMFFCRHPDAVGRAFAVSAGYMPPGAGGGSIDPYHTTAQWSRRAIGLKVFMALANLGLEGYAAMVEGMTRRGDELRTLLRSAGWRIVNNTPLPTVCFAHPALDRVPDWPDAILAEVYRRRRVWISKVLLGDRVPALRATVTSYRTVAADLDVLVEEVERARRMMRIPAGHPE